MIGDHLEAMLQSAERAQPLHDRGRGRTGGCGSHGSGQRIGAIVLAQHAQLGMVQQPGFGTVHTDSQVAAGIDLAPGTWTVERADAPRRIATPTGACPKTLASRTA